MGQNVNNRMIIPNKLPDNSVAMDIIAKSVKEIAKNLWSAAGMEFIDENQDVFTGSVADEIVKHQSHMHSLGVAMREGQTRHKFDQKM